jgi:hypothetical protein
MSEHEPDRDSFDDIARALAEQVSRAVERLSQIDMDEVTRTAGVEAERARQWVDQLGEWLRAQGETPGAAPFGFGFGAARASGPAGPHGPPAAEPAAGADDPLRDAGPHPLDLPTAGQGRALAALDSGRWKLEPGTSALAVHGDGPGPSDALGLVRELRVRDWLSGEGELTLAGRSALARWLDAAERG